MKILAVNPGSTSTKIALYDDKKEILRATLEHPAEKTDQFIRIIDQLPLRETEVLDYLQENKVDLSELSAVVGRGGMLPPLASGAYMVNDRMIDQLTNDPISEHASNLGALIAYKIAAPLGIPSYIYDPVSVDELSDIARISGLREVPRVSFSHALNSRAMAIKVSEKYGKKYNEMNIITAHLGGGITMSIHEKGRMADIIDDDEGPFSPERSGRVSCKGLTALCFSGKYDKQGILRKLRGQGGLKDYLGTSDVREVEKMIADGNKEAQIVFEAMAYQIAKGIGELSSVVCGKVDAIILTGGAAYSRHLTDLISERVRFIAPIELMPGENELEALAYGALRVLNGEEAAREYTA